MKYLFILLNILISSIIVFGQNNQQVQEIVIYKVVDSPAVPEGGMEKYLLAVAKKLPSRQVDVKVFVSIIIDDMGFLVQDSTAIIYKSNNSKVDKGIIKAVNSTDIKWIPASIDSVGKVYSKSVFPIYYKSN